MGRYRFIGGIHPIYNKELTSQKPIKKMEDPQIVVIPLSQHTGTPAKPIVNVGDKVKKGQLIGEAQGFVSVPVHASVSGKVVAIEKRLHPSGRLIEAIIIENDFTNSETIETMPPLNPEESSPQILRERIKEAGIVGMGGAAFPTHVKLSPPKEKPIDTVILNGAECEPYLTADHRLMLEEPESIVKGFLIIKKVVEAKHGIIGIEKNKEDAIKTIKKVVDDLKADVEVVELEVKYPQGAEKQLIYTLLKREVPSGGLPLDVGVVVQNVGTAKAVYDAVYQGKPLIERVTTVTGSNIKEPSNLLVKIGTLAKDLIEFCGGILEEGGKIIFGGPMMGVAQFSDEVPVIKGTSGIVLLREGESLFPKEGPCIRCGNCIRVCPMRLSPTILNKLVQASLFEEALKNDVLDCIECGCCSFSCPSNIPLVQRIRLGKVEAMAILKKEKK